eukprot:scaffold1548_cov237-Alexandrium_tamarense.AAC.10
MHAVHPLQRQQKNKHCMHVSLEVNNWSECTDTELDVNSHAHNVLSAASRNAPVSKTNNMIHIIPSDFNNNMFTSSNHNLSNNDWTTMCSKLEDMNESESIQDTKPRSKPIQLSNYDVLFSPGPSEHHVGNERFKVMLSLYRYRYLQANAVGDDLECLSIAQEIMETITSKCYPRGSFYEIGDDGFYRKLELGLSTVNLIRCALKKAFAPQAQCHGHHNYDEERMPKGVCRRIAGAEGFELLYEAANEMSEDLVSSPNKFDVICEATSHISVQQDGHVGNNRLKIMFDIRMEAYKIADSGGKLKIAREVVSSILDDVSARFLRLDTQSGMYKPLTRESAILYVQNSFEHDYTAVGEKETIRAEAIKNLLARKHKRSVLHRIESRKVCLDLVKPSMSPPSVALTALQRQPKSFASNAA